MTLHLLWFLQLGGVSSWNPRLSVTTCSVFLLRYPRLCHRLLCFLAALPQTMSPAALFSSCATPDCHRPLCFLAELPQTVHHRTLCFLAVLSQTMSPAALFSSCATPVCHRPLCFLAALPQTVYHRTLCFLAAPPQTVTARCFLAVLPQTVCHRLLYFLAALPQTVCHHLLCFLAALPQTAWWQPVNAHSILPSHLMPIGTGFSQDLQPRFCSYAILLAMSFVRSSVEF